MSEESGLLQRIMAKVRALLPEHWQGKPGERFRDNIGALSNYGKDNVRIRERLAEAPDVLWNSAKIKSSEALLHAADEENKRVATELARQILPDKARQEKATADRLESEARTAKINEMEARLELVEKLRSANAIPIWDDQGNMTIVGAPPHFDWNDFCDTVIPDVGLIAHIGITKGTNPKGISISGSIKEIGISSGPTSAPDVEALPPSEYPPRSEPSTG